MYIMQKVGGIYVMETGSRILILIDFCGALLFSRGVDNVAQKQLSGSSAIVLKAHVIVIEFGEYRNDDSIERKRSHKRRRVVRKPRKGRQR